MQKSLQTEVTTTNYEEVLFERQSDSHSNERHRPLLNIIVKERLRTERNVSQNVPSENGTFRPDKIQSYLDVVTSVFDDSKTVGKLRLSTFQRRKNRRKRR